MCGFKDQGLSIKYMMRISFQLSDFELFIKQKTFFQIYLFIIDMYSLMCMYLHVHIWCPWRPEKSSGNQAQVLCKNSKFVEQLRNLSRPSS